MGERSKSTLESRFRSFKSFYEESDELPESYEIEKQALQEQYEPRITVQIINGGLFYVTANHFLS